ncbi:hypothetical protein WK77_16130 [Burkholderia ubonensis]|nr:hypothetical protein WK77_16130 [Burkholderia ubonensis]
MIVRLIAPPDREHVFGVLSNASADEVPDNSTFAWIVNDQGQKHESTLPLPLPLGHAEYEPLASRPDDVAHLKVLYSRATLRNTDAILQQAERRVIRSLVAAGGSEKLYRKALTLVQGAGNLSYPSARQLGIDVYATHLSQSGLIAQRRVAVKDAHGVVRGAKVFFEKPQHVSLHDDYVALKEAAFGSTSALNRLFRARGLDESMLVAIRALEDDDLKSLCDRINGLYENKTEFDRIPNIALHYSKEFEDLISQSPFHEVSKPRDAPGIEAAPN